ncbi:MAG: enoyl-CoA hydratase/isomerase family protein [Pigmentiphaga sp.]|uniref:enoyl-CoA hydratase/isomerase family protein n=1 Tax=Pigmentiphaga sp. TaxID=1977564 RepID=UPI0029ACB616|nr:enoyl-CoA hydratase/isomerase family protein [Pigmentiphaga sp.]MDX3908120.1 enoyl-CoA hydratase/isomerase family protein [Pigmentiphaga sp.]
MSELLIENRGAVRILTMNRPEKHNALNTALTQALHDALWQAEADGAVHAVILTGAGKSFCAGADTSEFSSLVPEDPLAVNARADLTTRLHLAFSRLSKPVVAAVRGNALGGGAGLAIACDLAVMAENVRFGYPELKHGIVAAVVMSNLVRQLGRKHAFELLSMGEPIDGARALALGLANRVAPDAQVLDAAVEMAEKLAGWSPVAMGTTKRLFHRVAELTLEEGLAAGRDVNVIMRGFRKVAK